jgi:hypothetical protein
MAGDIRFQSSTYEWLVVAPSRAQFKGMGTLNGMDGFGFLLTAIDGGTGKNATPDKFRIKIWDTKNNDLIVYDNQMGESETGDAATIIGGGNILIHR